MKKQIEQEDATILGETLMHKHNFSMVILSAVSFSQASFSCHKFRCPVVQMWILMKLAY